MWVYDHTLGAYYDAESQTYALPGDEWTYVPAKDFASGSREEVGWGALEEEPKKHPAYGGKPEPEVQRNEVLRLVVKSSKVLEKGSIAIVDMREEGVQLGRDRVAGGGRIRLKEMEASKTHAVVFWDDGWNVVDLGSTHGTHVDDRRLSDPKQSSKPQRLKHLSTIRIGSTTFIAHIHGSWPCDECKLAGANEIQLDDGREKPVETYAMNSQERRDNREVKRKREMAALREALVGDAPRPKRPATRKWAPPPEPAKPTFAETMLAKQGWGGGGLGKHSDGRATPVEVDMRGERKGLGAVDALRDGDDWKQRAKQRRYKEIRDA